ncbi:hypothetical protein EVA_01095 [gut metagenome]|uniref:Uncharacterized protein n=1 Tax=gut metagenome TaxID=749906 RepID=J9DC50_9ZZZZ
MCRCQWGLINDNDLGIACAVYDFVDICTVVNGQFT